MRPVGGSRVLNISRIDHISMAVPKLGPQIKIFEGLFGFRAGEEWSDGENGYVGVSLDVPGRSDIKWEVMAPVDPSGHIQRFLDSPRGPGLHHVALEVPDVGEAVEELHALGVATWGVEPAESDQPDVAFIHPRQGNGFLFQIVLPERHGHPSSADDATDGSWDNGDSLGIKAINHLSHAYQDADELARWYEAVFGMERIYTLEDASSPFFTRVLETPTRQMRWEILQPNGSDSFVQRFLDQRGPAMHHVALEVEDWDRAIDACRRYGAPVFGEQDSATDGVRWREAFIHPRHTGGLLTQFFWQERPGVWI